MNQEDLGVLQGDDVGGALPTVEHRNLAGGIPGPRKLSTISLPSTLLLMILIRPEIITITVSPRSCRRQMTCPVEYFLLWPRCMSASSAVLGDRRKSVMLEEQPKAFANEQAVFRVSRRVPPRARRWEARPIRRFAGLDGQMIVTGTLSLGHAGLPCTATPAESRVWAVRASTRTSIGAGRDPSVSRPSALASHLQPERVVAFLPRQAPAALCVPAKFTLD